MTPNRRTKSPPSFLYLFSNIALDAHDNDSTGEVLAVDDLVNEVMWGIATVLVLCAGILFGFYIGLGFHL